MGGIVSSIANGLISPFLQPCLFDPLKERIRLLRSLEQNAESLSDKSNTIRSLKDDVYGRLQERLRSDQHNNLSHQVLKWFGDVKTFLDRYANFSASFASRDPSCSFRFGCRSNYKLAKRADVLLSQAVELVSQGTEFTNDTNLLVIRAAHPMIEEIPIYTEVVAQEGEFSKTLDLINGGEADTIGICGMGGVGKTTVLEKINNHFCGNRDNFDIVVWVDINRDMNIERIREDLLQKLGLPKGSDANNLLRFLNDTSFLLLMDDVWDPLKFREIGIPPLSIARKRKVVLTTRSRDVCYSMGIKEENIVSMGSLPSEQSWKLFCLHVNNEDILHDPSIEPLARNVANKCGGLPLALRAVGKTMAGARRDYEWTDAVMDLEVSAHAFQGMAQVHSTLKFSYDRLENNGMREILLYCSLYPQGHNIFEEDLIGMLMEEGLFNTNNISRDHARAKLRTWISGIINAGLLLRHMEDTVKLHDCVREMALWLTDGQFDESTLFVRSSPEKSSKDFPCFLRGWKKAKRTSMVYSGLETISDDVPSPHCKELVTLLWEMGRIVHIPHSFFMHMPHLRVLNLSNSGIKVVPRSIGRLHHLKYLNLQSTPIKRLPEEIGDLVQLVQLILRYAHLLTYISRRSISRLHKLERLDMLGTEYRWSWHDSFDLGLNDLENLARNKLSDIGITLISCDPLIDYFPNSVNLTSSITQLELLKMGDYTFNQGECSKRLSERLQILHVNYGRKLTFEYVFFELRELSLSQVGEVIFTGTCVFQVLSKLTLTDCSNLDPLILAEYIFPCLKVLRVDRCDTVESLLVSNNGFTSFRFLKKLSLSYCRRLRKISDIALEFRSLEEVDIRGCDALKTIPFDDGSAPRLRSIKGTAEWCNQLEWKDESVKSKFLPRFVALPEPLRIGREPEH